MILSLFGAATAILLLALPLGTKLEQRFCESD